MNDSNDSQSLNVFTPIVSIEEGIVTCLSNLQFKNAEFPKDFNEDKSEISQRLTQFWKQKSPIEVTDDGIEIFLSNLQSENALSLISTTVEGISISLSSLQ